MKPRGKSCSCAPQSPEADSGLLKNARRYSLIASGSGLAATCFSGLELFLGFVDRVCMAKRRVSADGIQLQPVQQLCCAHMA